MQRLREGGELICVLKSKRQLLHINRAPAFLLYNLWKCFIIGCYSVSEYQEHAEPFSGSGEIFRIQAPSFMLVILEIIFLQTDINTYFLVQLKRWFVNPDAVFQHSFP